MRRLFPPPARDVSAERVYTILQFSPPPDDRPTVVVNFVSSVDGRTVVDGSAALLGSGTDHALMLRLRAQADALMHGAATARVDHLGVRLPEPIARRRARLGLQPQLAEVIVSRAGNLSPQAPVFQEDLPTRPLVFTETNADSLRVQLGDLADVRASAQIADSLRVLRRELGMRLVVCEGGALLLGSLLAANLVDELFWTVAPKLAGGAPSPMTAGLPFRPLRRLSLVSIYQEESELFLRYRVTRP